MLLDQATFEKKKIVLLIFEKNTLNDDGMMIMNIQIYQVRPYDNFSFKKSYGSILASLN
jgi:hypothetical protein